MKRNLIIIAATLLIAAGLSAQTVVGTSHDLSSGSGGATTNVDRVCVFCHTPHQATAANGQDPLWNHTLSGAGPYTAYGSNTLDASVANIPVATAGSAAVSNLCLSCHDGTISVASLYNPPNEVASITVTAGGNVLGTGLMTGTANVGTDLSNDHPVNFTYDGALVTADGELKDPTSAAVSALLSGGTVQCSSCHDPHDNTFPPFMVVDNTDSALCTTCHIK